MVVQMSKEEKGIVGILLCPHCGKKIKVGIPKKTAKSVLHSFKAGKDTANLTIIWEAITE
jgi:hypothetical protein